MSTYKSALACEEVREPEVHATDLLSMRPLTFCKTSSEAQSASLIVKVSGSITVSF